MTITGITSTIIPAHLPAKPAVTSAEQAAPNLAHSVEDERHARTKAFYTREAEPWLKGYNKSEMTPEQSAAAKEMYLSELKRDSIDALKSQGEHYGKCLTEVGIYRQDLAKKNFSYTLGDDGKVKLLDPENSFTEHERKYLTSLLNEDKKFTNSVVKFAKLAMELVDHDDKAFGGKYKLDLLNFKDTVDYRKLMTSDSKDIYKNLINQILEKGEKREEPLVDVVA